MEILYRKVTSEKMFTKEIELVAKQKRSKLFNCYVQQDFFVISTANKIVRFDFSHYDSEVEVVRYIQKAYEILAQKLPQQLLLFDAQFIPA